MEDIIKDLEELEKEEGMATEQAEQPVVESEEPQDIQSDLAEPEQPAEEPVEQPVEEPAEAPEETPEEKQEESSQEETEEPVAKPEPQPEPILGKFKTQEDLIKAYQNLEKQLTKKSQQVAETAKVQSTDFDKMIEEEESKVAWALLEKAINTIEDKEHHKEAVYALEMYKRTFNDSYIKTARGFLDPRVDVALDYEYRNQSAAIRQEANKYRHEVEYQPAREAIEELEAEDSEWLHEQTHADLMMAAISLNPKVNVKSVKALINAAEEKAVERYKAKEAKRLAKEHERKPSPSINTAQRPEPPKPKKDWQSMSIEEQLREEFGL